MSQDKTELFNLAVSTMGSRGVKISSPDEASREAEECRLWYEPARNSVFRAAFWPSCKAYFRLPVLGERDNDASWLETDPEPGWRFAYSAPNDMLYPRYLTNYARFSTGTQKIVNGEVSAIFTSQEEPILVYTKEQENVALWDAQLYMAIAQALAFFISAPLHGKLSFKEDAEKQANILILQARESAANEPEEKLEVLPEWLAARGYDGVPVQNKFTYPFGPLLGSAAGGGNVG